MKNKKSSKSKAFKSLKALFRGKIKFAIYSYFEIYRRLTSNQICELVNRSKPTVHDHLKDLISMGVIAEPQYRDKDGNFIYEFSPDYEEKLKMLDAEFDYSDGLTMELMISLAKGVVNMLNTFQSLLKKEISFFKNLIEKCDDKNVQHYRSITEQIMDFEYDENGKIKIDEIGIPFHNSKLFNTFLFLDNDTYTEFRQDFHKLLLKYEDKMIENTNINKERPIERPICFLAHSMPVKIILGENLKRKGT